VSAPSKVGEGAGTGALARLWQGIQGGLRHLVLLPVYLWRAAAPMRAPRCRFHPSCSTYAVQAVRGHGVLRGSVLATRRVGSCHPWNPGGFDHVPEPDDRTAWRRRLR